MLYLTYTMIFSVDLAHYGVSRAKNCVCMDCGTTTIIKCNHDLLTNSFFFRSGNFICPEASDLDINKAYLYLTIHNESLHVQLHKNSSMENQMNGAMVFI